MQIRYVTITGADDNTSITDLVELGLDFPLIEWGILLGREANMPRYPSREWIIEMAKAASHSFLNLSLHLCGHWARRLILGEHIWMDIPTELMNALNRVQINLGGKLQTSHFNMIEAVRLTNFPEVIIQGDGVNDHLAYALSGNRIRTSILYDRSGGRGIAPNQWPRPSELPCGYAGGIGPTNIEQALTQITSVCKHPFWIDMETHVRTNDRLDLVKVRQVLEKVMELRKVL